ncbi:MAG: AsmA family protein [Betaproteobacteria bacterium]
MTLPRSLKWMAGAFLALVLLLVLFLVFFDWNWMREPIARRVSAATGRTFAINGDLTVSLSMQPRVVVNDIVLGNAAGSSDTRMASFKKLDFRFDLFKLLTGRLELPEVALIEPNVLLEVNDDGAGNWMFAQSKRDEKFDLPAIDRLTIERGKVTYRDVRMKTDLALDVHTLAAGKDQSESRLEVSGKGQFKGLPTSLHAIGGALLNARVEGKSPYPIEASASFGATKTHINGTLLDPLHFTAQQLNFTIEGSNLAQLYPLIGVPIPPTAAYKLAGFLDHSSRVWTFRGLKGTVGESDLAGDFTVDRNPRPQKITANLVSQKLTMRDLGGFIGASPGKQAKSLPTGGRILPTEPFSPEKLQIADADIHFRGAHIVTEKMPLENMSTHLVVKGGVLTLAPVDFGAAGGHLIAQVEMDGRRAPIATHVDLVARGLDLAKMFPNSRLAADNTGTMGGRAKLVGQGSSVAQLLATANGEAALIMDGGTIGELTLRLANLDIANSLLLLIGGDKQAPIRCMVGNFNAVNGVFTVQELVLDTAKVNITGTGNANFSDESLHLRLVAKSKGFSLASLRGPIAITGSFTAPVAKPELGGVMVRGGAAVALGVATAGIGALLPLLDFGKQKDSNCAALISEAKTDVGVKASDIRSTKRAVPVTQAPSKK